MTVTQNDSKFIEWPRFVLNFGTTERMKMRRFEEGVAVYIPHQLASQPIHTYQDLYKRAAEVERVKT